MLGIKYESAVLAGLEETRLWAIVEQIKEEAGEGWKADPAILQGRNAVREEQGLEKLDGTHHKAAAKRNPARRSLLGRWLKRRPPRAP